MSFEMDRRQFFAFGGAAGAVALLPERLLATVPEASLIESIRAKHGAPAAAGMIVTRDASPYLQAAGVRRFNTNDRVSRDDKWHLGSNTKAMTAAVYARLVEHGRAKWEAPLAELFPNLAPTMHQDWKAQPVEHLLGHSSGIVDDAYDPDRWEQEAQRHKSPALIVADRAALARRIFSAPPTGTVGKFAYSNAGYILLGAAIEGLTGRPWEAVMKEQLFDPLNMASAGFGPPAGPNPWGHRLDKNQLVPMNPQDPASDNPPAVGPAGTVHVSLADYSNFLRIFLTAGGGFLRPESIQKLTTPIVTEPRPYACGWLVLEKFPITGRTVLGHEGSNTFWWAVTLVSPELGSAVVGVANSGEPSGSGAAKEVAMTLAKMAASSS